MQIINQLNRASASQAKRYPVVMFLPEKRETGAVHQEDTSGGTMLLSSQLDGNFRGHCNDALKAFNAARNAAAEKGTYPGMALRVTTKILTPLTLVVTGATTAILAYNGFSGLLRKILYGQ